MSNSAQVNRIAPDWSNAAQSSLSTAAARNLSSTTKSVPQTQEATSRWLLRILPWVQTSGGTYRLNRRRTYAVGSGRVTFTNTGAKAQLIPQTLTELPALREFDDQSILQMMADSCTQQEFKPGDVIAEAGQPIDQIFLIAHGKARVLRAGHYDDQVALSILGDGDHFGSEALMEPHSQWEDTIKAITHCTVLVLPRKVLTDLMEKSKRLAQHLEQNHDRSEQRVNKYGEALIDMVSGHVGEQLLPSSFVDYELTPREYELSAAQTILRLHTRIADLYNGPMDQTEQQLRLTIEALRERQEYDLINSPDFGLLHNATYEQRIRTRSGPPTPDDLDELLSRRRHTNFMLATPKALAAFGRECSRRGLTLDTVELNGGRVPSWRGVPILPCTKIPTTEARTTSIIAMRVGEDNGGVIGLHQTGIPDEYEPGLSVRFMGIDEKALISYLVTAYYSVAVLLPDALGILEDVEVGHYAD